MSTGGLALVALAIAVGLVGIIVPILPGHSTTATVARIAAGGD